MKSRVKLLKIENISGTSAKTGNEYDMDFLNVLDLDNFDKFKVIAPKDQLDILRSFLGKDGILEVSVNPKSEKLEFSAFKAAA